MGSSNIQKNDVNSESVPPMQGFEIGRNLEFREKILRDDGSWAFTTFDTRLNASEWLSGDFAVHVYPPTSSPSSCSSFALGSSNLSERVVEGTTVWTGKVDAYDVGILYDYIGHKEPPCVPPNASYSADEDGYGDGMARGDDSDAYVLCSEKDGKRVVVCIQQMTDNPEQAEEIFSTFRWTE
ncbi:MAG: hypothetical protein ABL890_00960 [Candidatus Peribacteraceae bacterium]